MVCGPELSKLVKYYLHYTMGFPNGSVVKNPPVNARSCRRYMFDPWVGKIPWRRKWLPTPVFLPGESHGQRSLVGYSPCGLQSCPESDMTEVTYRASTHSAQQGCSESCTHFPRGHYPPNASSLLALTDIGPEYIKFCKMSGHLNSSIYQTYFTILRGQINY